MLIDINMWYQKMVSMILESQDDSSFDDNRTATSYPIATRPLIAGQRDYSFLTAAWTLQGPESAANVTGQSLLPLKTKRVDVTYDGITYFRATEFDDGVPQWGFGSETMEDSNFTTVAPYYGVKYNSIFLFPMATAGNVTAGATLRLELDRAVVPFSKTADYAAINMSASTSVPGVDLPWHPMLAYGAAYEFANANNLPQLANIKQDLTDWEARLRIAYGRKDKDVLLYMRPAYDAYGDYGTTGAGGDYYGR